MPTIRSFIEKHQLPSSYPLLVEKWFKPLADDLASQKKGMAETFVVGISGAQGSGKSTLAAILVHLFESEYGLKALALSLDDFYYTRDERTQLAKTIHPLLQTRGVPGTHDLALATQVLKQLKFLEGICFVPRFNKLIDDRRPEAEWSQVLGEVDIVILEGWCLGAEPQHVDDLVSPVNDLESVEDVDCIWRNYVNQQLRDGYPDLFSYIDSWVMLKAPSFDCIYQWRLEQESKLRMSEGSGKSNAYNAMAIMSDNDIARFIMFFQRITEQQLLKLPEKVDYLFELNEQREIQKMTIKNKA